MTLIMQGNRVRVCPCCLPSLSSITDLYYVRRPLSLLQLSDRVPPTPVVGLPNGGLNFPRLRGSSAQGVCHMDHPKVLVKEVRVVDHEDRVLGDCVGLEGGSMEGRDRWSPWFWNRV